MGVVDAMSAPAERAQRADAGRKAPTRTTFILMAPHSAARQNLERLSAGDCIPNAVKKTKSRLTSG
jgi:hypothetical protein